MLRVNAHMALHAAPLTPDHNPDPNCCEVRLWRGRYHHHLITLIMPVVIVIIPLKVRLRRGELGCVLTRPQRAYFVTLLSSGIGRLTYSSARPNTVSTSVLCA